MIYTILLKNDWYTYCLYLLHALHKKYRSQYITCANSTDLFTFCFTEVGKGYITPWDLERMATMILSGQILRYLR